MTKIVAAAVVSHNHGHIHNLTSNEAAIASMCERLKGQIVVAEVTAIHGIHPDLRKVIAKSILVMVDSKRLGEERVASGVVRGLKRARKLADRLGRDVIVIGSAMLYEEYYSHVDEYHIVHDHTVRFSNQPIFPLLRAKAMEGYKLITAQSNESSTTVKYSRRVAYSARPT